jgi:hypothetical protein
MSAIEWAITVGGFASRIFGLAFIAIQVRQPNRPVQYIADLQAAILLRTDRTDKDCG